MNHTAALIVALLIAALSIVYFSVLPTMAEKADRQFCVSLMESPISVSQEAITLHSAFLVADLHSDNLLWDRDFLARLDHGHLDLPRMQEGNMAIQVFDAVIKVPRGLNYQSNKGDTDQLIKLAIANRWPIATWFNLTNRALHQAKLLYDAAKRSDRQLYIITSAVELKSFLNIRQLSKRKVVGGLLSVEGLHALEGKLENVYRLYDAGYRILGLTHFFDNEVGGSSGGAEKGGITEFGRSVIRRMEELSLTIDLAHASSMCVFLSG